MRSASAFSAAMRAASASSSAMRAASAFSAMCFASACAASAAAFSAAMRSASACSAMRFASACSASACSASAAAMRAASASSSAMRAALVWAFSAAMLFAAAINIVTNSQNGNSGTTFNAANASAILIATCAQSESLFQCCAIQSRTHFCHLPFPVVLQYANKWPIFCAYMAGSVSPFAANSKLHGISTNICTKFLCLSNVSRSICGCSSRLFCASKPTAASNTGSISSRRRVTSRSLPTPTKRACL